MTGLLVRLRRCAPLLRKRPHPGESEPARTPNRREPRPGANPDPREPRPGRDARHVPEWLPPLRSPGALHTATSAPRTQALPRKRLGALGAHRRAPSRTQHRSWRRGVRIQSPVTAWMRHAPGKPLLRRHLDARRTPRDAKCTKALPRKRLRALHVAVRAAGVRMRGGGMLLTDVAYPGGHPCPAGYAAPSTLDHAAYGSGHR